MKNTYTAANAFPDAGFPVYWMREMPFVLAGQVEVAE